MPASSRPAAPQRPQSSAAPQRPVPSQHPNAAPRLTPPKRGFQMFGRVGEVSGPSGGGIYFKDGTYHVRLEKITAQESQQGEGEFVAVEFTILETLVAYEGSNTPGQRVSVLYMGKHGDVAVQNFRGLLGAATGMDPYATDPDSATYASPKEWTEAAEKSAEGSGEALKGTILACTAMTILTKKRKQEFTKTQFNAVDDATIERLTGLAIEGQTTA